MSDSYESLNERAARTLKEAIEAATEMLCEHRLSEETRDEIRRLRSELIEASKTLNVMLDASRRVAEASNASAEVPSLENA